MNIGTQIKRPFAWFWYTATLKTKVIIVVIIAILISVALLWSCRDTKPAIEDDQSYKVLEGENNQLREQNAGLRKEYEELILKGQALELERDGLRVELERFGKQAAEGVKIQKEAAELYEKEMGVINIDVPAVDRCKRYCSSRAELGYPCRPNLDTYCERYAAAGDGR